jgi:hypothetical protein
MRSCPYSPSPLQQLVPPVFFLRTMCIYSMAILVCCSMNDDTVAHECAHLLKFLLRLSKRNDKGWHVLQYVM